MRQKGILKIKIITLTVLALMMVYHHNNAETEKVPLYSGEIKPGMIGYCITEISQGQKEIIDLEIIGKVEGGSLNQTYILVSLLGDAIEKYGVAAGMSGSPVYIEGELLGALAFTYPFQKESIAGVTLINHTVEQCNSIESLDFYKLANIQIKSLHEELLFNNMLTGEEGFYLPISGISSDDKSPVNAYLPMAFTPVYTPSLTPGPKPTSVSGSGIGGKDLQFDPSAILEAGDTFGLLLMKGDMDITAFGTITMVDRDNNSAYGLGHPAFSLGSWQIPVTRARTIHTVPSTNVSFKVAENINIIGTMVSDSNAGIKVSLDREPSFISLDILLNADKEAGGEVKVNEKRYQFEMSRFNLALPSLFQNASFGSVRDFIGTYNTRSIDATVSFKGMDGTRLTFRNIYNGFTSFPQFITEISNIISILLFNEYSEFPLDSIETRIDIKNDYERYSLINCSISTKVPKQGEDIDINMLLTSNKNNTLVKKTKLRVPEYFPDSKGMIIVSDNRYYILFEMMRDPQRFTPKNYNELIRLIMEYPTSNKIYIMLYSFAPSYSIDGKELINLPVFYEKMMSLDQSLVYKRNFSLQDLIILEMDYAISGGKVFPVEIFYN